MGLESIRLIDRWYDKLLFDSDRGCFEVRRCTDPKTFRFPGYFLAFGHRYISFKDPILRERFPTAIEAARAGYRRVYATF